MVKKLLLLTLLFVLFGTGIVAAQNKKQEPPPTLRDKHQLGLRLGVWSNNGTSVPSSIIGIDTTTLMRTSISDASFYLEGFFAYNIMPQLFAELSFGLVNRGSVTVYDYSTTDVGNLLIYPILLQLKFYPLASTNLRLQPYITGGGGVYYGRRDVQFTDSYYYYYGFDPDSETDLNYVFGGGVDWLLNNRLALDVNAKYMTINFSNRLLTVSKYDALTITAGIKYMVGNNN